MESIFGNAHAQVECLQNIKQSNPRKTHRNINTPYGNISAYDRFRLTKLESFSRCERFIFLFINFRGGRIIISLDICARSLRERMVREEYGRVVDPEVLLSRISWSEIVDPSENTVSRLTHICETIGFFVICGHPVPPTIIRRVSSATQKFCSLPEEFKERYGHENQMVTPKSCRGYTATEKLGYDESVAKDTKQVYDLGIDRPLQDGVPFTGPLIMPTDEEAPDFTKSLLELQDVVVSKMVLPVARALALALGKPRDFFDEYMKEPHLVQRVVYYPAKEGSAGKHTDLCLFTLLFQEQGSWENGHGSLQVNSNGRWIPVEAHETEVVVNIGDCLQYWTGSRFVSTPHQVVHNGSGSRVSMPFFFYPNIMSEFVPMHSTDGEKVRVQDIATSGFDSIWVTKKGSGRAKDVMVL